MTDTTALPLMCAYYALFDAFDCDRDGCGEQAMLHIVAAFGQVQENLCPRHAATHMRGNAYAIAGADDPPDALEAQILNELDRFELP